MKRNLLIIEDETSVAKQLKWGLSSDYDITIASDTTRAKELIATGVFPVATLDLGLPPHPDTPREGFALLEELPRFSTRTKVIVITGNTEKEYAMKSIALGATDFYEKPIDLKLLKITLERAFIIADLEEENRKLQSMKTQGGSFCGMLGLSPAITKIFEQVEQASKTEYPVLITGKTGTGKEMVAQAVHSLSSRAKDPLIIINCAAIPENLLESELFGHEKGSFTGANKRQIGKFELADNGTIFLDEIGELPLPLQGKLLRVLQESTIDRVGGATPIHLNVRILAATNIDLKQKVEEGAFREDLHFRLNVIPLALPDLKDRPEDILLLAQSFLHEEALKLKKKNVLFSPAAFAQLTSYDWPGNVRELKNRIQRALATAKENSILPEHLGLDSDEHTNSIPPIRTLKEARERAEKAAVLRSLSLCNNNISQAAKFLEVSRPTLHDLIKKYEIST
jgi:two-component system, NtrC family, response regulator